MSTFYSKIFPYLDAEGKVLGRARLEEGQGLSRFYPYIDDDGTLKWRGLNSNSESVKGYSGVDDQGRLCAWTGGDIPSCLSIESPRSRWRNNKQATHGIYGSGGYNDSFEAEVPGEGILTFEYWGEVDTYWAKTSGDFGNDKDVNNHFNWWFAPPHHWIARTLFWRVDVGSSGSLVKKWAPQFRWLYLSGSSPDPPTVAGFSGVFGQGICNPKFPHPESQWGGVPTPTTTGSTFSEQTGVIVQDDPEGCFLKSHKDKITVVVFGISNAYDVQWGFAHLDFINASEMNGQWDLYYNYTPPEDDFDGTFFKPSIHEYTLFEPGGIHVYDNFIQVTADSAFGYLIGKIRLVMINGFQWSLRFDIFNGLHEPGEIGYHNFGGGFSDQVGGSRPWMGHDGHEDVLSGTYPPLTGVGDIGSSFEGAGIIPLRL